MQSPLTLSIYEYLPLFTLQPLGTQWQFSVCDMLLYQAPLKNLITSLPSGRKDTVQCTCMFFLTLIDFHNYDAV